MRILFTANSAWNLYNFRLGLMRGLRAEGYQVMALAPPDGYAAELQAAGFPFYPLRLQATGLSPWQDLRFFAQLYRFYGRLRPDIVLHFTIKPNVYGTLAACLRRRPAVNNISGLGTSFLAGSALRLFTWGLYGVTLPKAKHVFFQNPEDRTLLHKGLWWWSRGQSSCLPGSGVDLKRFHPAAESDKNGPAAERFTFLMIGRLIKDKGVLEYAKAAALCHRLRPGLRFQLIGPYEPTHKRAVRAQTLATWQETGCVEYLGEQRDVLPFLASADAVVLPSYREGMPRSLLEGAAMGKPLVASDAPGCRSVVQHAYNGLLCRVRDAHDLARALLRLAAMPAEARAQLGRNGRTHVSRYYDEQLVVKAYLRKILEIHAVGIESLAT